MHPDSINPSTNIDPPLQVKTNRNEERNPAEPNNHDHPATTSKNNFTTNIKQINLQKKKSACKTYFKELKSNDIMLCQEPYCLKNKLPFIPTTHKSFMTYSKTGNVRAAIITPRDLGDKSFILSPFSNKDMVTIKCNYLHGGQKTVFCSIYMAHDPNKPDIDPDIVQKIENLVEFTKKEKLNLIIGSDCNGHNNLWNSTKNCRRGKKVALLMNQLNLNVENKNSCPTFVNTRGHSSIIDITLTNASASKHVSNWNVSKIPSLSDHRMITFRYDMENLTVSYSKNFNNFDPDVFKKEIENHFEKHPFEKRIVTEKTNIRIVTKNMAQINDALTKALDKACPTIETKHKSKCPWSKDLTVLKKKVIKAKRRAIRSKNDTVMNAEARHILAESESDFKKEINKVNKAAYTNFCTNLKNNKNLAKTTKKKKEHWEQLNILKKKDGQHTKSSEETLETLMDEHFPQHQNILPLQVTQDKIDQNMINEIINH